MWERGCRDGISESLEGTRPAGPFLQYQPSHLTSGMAKLPGFMFYPGDWVKDPDLSRCSKAAKGMWIDMLCKAFECEERGVFISARQPWTNLEIAAAVGGDVAANLMLLDELLVKGVAKIDKRGAILCLRMVRDEQKRQLCSEAGKKGGGNPSLQSQSYTTYKGTSKGRVKGTSKGESKGISEYENVFDLLWNKYPNKDGKIHALKHFHASVKTSQDAEDIQQALSNYLKHLETNGTGAKFIKNGSTWFNNWRDWVDWKEPSLPAAESQRKFVV